MPNDFDWNVIQAAYDNGLTYRELISKFGVSSASIQRARDRGDFLPRPKNYHRDGICRHNWVLIQKLYDGGMSQRKLQNEYGIAFGSFTKAQARGQFVSRNLKESAKVCKDQGWKPTPMGQDARKALSERQSLNNSGGRCKWFDVGGQRVQGTWERDAGIKLTELGIEWRKCGGKADIIEYEMDGKKRRYTPDFYLPSFDLYLEFKGYWWGDDRRKMDEVLAVTSNRIVIVEKGQYADFLNGKLPF